MDNKKVGIGIGIALLIIIIGLVFYFLPKGEEKIYKVTFDNDGVTEVVDVKEADVVVKPNDPTKEGYTFEGWYYNGTKFDFTTGITEDITLEARWILTDAQKWVVRFDAAGGKYIENLNVVDGEIIEEIPTPVKEGYTFIGWYNGTNAFDFKTKITKNITLTAKWKKIVTSNEPAKTTTYTVKFDTNGGDTTVANQKVEEGKNITKPSNPKKDGYTFIGWYYNGALYNFSTAVTSNITLTAKWEKVSVITYKIEEIEESYVGQVRIFVLQDGVKVDGIVDITTTSGKVVTKEISKDGYITNGSKIKSISNVKVK